MQLVQARPKASSQHRMGRCSKAQCNAQYCTLFICLTFIMQTLTEHLCKPPPQLDGKIAVNMLLPVVALPHFLYAFIWFMPKQWQAAFGNRSVKVFAFCGLVGKLLQFSAVGLWLWTSRKHGLCFSGADISYAQLLTGLALLAFGQQLNVGIFNAIGTDGVYYGFKLGVKVPWVNGYPFNVIQHPQYVGSVLTIWGILVLVLNQLALADSLALAVYWTLLYAVTAIQEQYL